MATTSAKPVLAALKTPLSATYPSELQSPLVAASPAFLKREECEKTPITPPAAYLDFLKALSPVLMSPLATGTSSKFSFCERPTSTISNSSFTSVSSAPSVKEVTSSEAPEKPASPAAIVSKPARSNSCSSVESEKSARKADDDKETDSTTPPAAPPTSPFIRPMSARTPRRLHIPQSPYSPAGVRSPMSAHSVRSPYSATMSPREWDWDKTKPPGSATSRAVSVRQVVTRTVTYSRTPVEATPPAPLDPAPRGKRRKLE